MFVLKSSAIEAERGLTLREAVPQTSHAGSSWELPKPAETLPGKICRKRTNSPTVANLPPESGKLSKHLFAKAGSLGKLMLAKHCKYRYSLRRAENPV